MSLSNFMENELQALLFNNTAIGNLGDVAGLPGSSGPGSLYVALHTADPTESPSSQSTFEASYPGYARKAVARSGAGWTISAEQASNTALIAFGQHSGGSPASQTMTHFSLGLDDGSPTDTVIYSGNLTGSLNVTSGVNPTFAIGQLQVNVN